MIKKFLFLIFSTILLIGGQAMAITVNIYYTGENGNARKFAEEMEQSGTVAAIRAEEGNKKYEYFYPKNDPETVLLIDSWESQEAIDKHHATPMMDKIAELRNKYDLHMRVERFIEDNTIPEQDQNFIRK
jgi:quinol monooxygenase YgiN